MLIILAVISIQAVFGENGIIKTATQASENYREKKEIEEIKLALNEWNLEEVSNPEKTFVSFMEEKFGTENVTANGETTVIVKMKSENQYRVTKDGTVTKVGEEANQLNEYGFYYGVPYIADTANGKQAMVFYSNGNSEMFMEAIEGVLMNYSIDFDNCNPRVEYANKTIKITYTPGESDVEMILSVSENGQEISCIMDDQGNTMTARCDFTQIPHGGYVGKTYEGEYNSQKISMVVNSDGLLNGKLGEQNLDLTWTFHDEWTLIDPENTTSNFVIFNLDGTKAYVRYYDIQVMLELKRENSTETPETPELPKGPNGNPLVTALTEIQGTTVYAEDRLGNSVVVPGGFKVVAGELVQDGIVIEDNNITTYEDGTTSTGNQFVWIPVSNIDNSGNNKIKIENADKTVSEIEITLGRYTFADSSATVPGVPTLVQSGSNYDDLNQNNRYTINGSIEKSVSREEFQESNQVDDATGTNATARDLAGFISSVSTNKGYYIARYEASYESGTTFGVGNNSTYYKPASKISKYNSISSMSYTAGTLWNFITQGNASKASRQMYYGDSFVESDLVNSYAWDTAIVYIQAMGNSNYANASGGSSTSLLNTGETEDEKCHIYDMSANEMEWTTETNLEMAEGYLGAVPRGGTLLFFGEIPTRQRTQFSPTENNGLCSFRTVLYNKNVN